jgi:predicted DNA-binding transcriptional regulator AlpA
MSTPTATYPARSRAKNRVANEETLLLDAAALGRILGLSSRTVRRKHADGLIPRPLNIGGSVRWNRIEILGWIEAGCPPRENWDAALLWA